MKLEENTLGTVKLTQILHIVEIIRKHSRGKTDENIEVTMEFLVGSLFPELYQNFSAKIASEYQRGFLDGYNSKDLKKEEENEVN